MKHYLIIQTLTVLPLLLSVLLIFIGGVELVAAPTIAQQLASFLVLQGAAILFVGAIIIDLLHIIYLEIKKNK